jgi:hypothetical protein
VHGAGALSGAPGAPHPEGARLRRAAAKSALLGAILHLAAALLVHLLPPLRAGRLYPVLAALAAGATGLLCARAARGAPVLRLLPAAGAAATAAGLTGALLLVLLGRLPLELLLVAAVTSGVAGLLGVPLGRVRRAPRA